MSLFFTKNKNCVARKLFLNVSFKMYNIALDPNPNWDKIMFPDPNSMCIWIQTNQLVDGCKKPSWPAIFFGWCVCAVCVPKQDMGLGYPLTPPDAVEGILGLIGLPANKERKKGGRPEMNPFLALAPLFKPSSPTTLGSLCS